MLIKCIATCFGYDDPGDDGKGAFGDDNDNTHTVGVSIPIPILRASIGYTKELVKAHTATVEVGGKTVTKIAITDEGPGEEGELIWGRRTGLGHLLDMTYALCVELGIRYDPNKASYVAQYSLQDKNGNDIPIKGLNGPRHYVND